MFKVNELDGDATDVLDLQTVLNRLGGDWALAQDVARIVLEDAPILIGELETGLREESAERVALSAHSLKGLVSNFNADACAAAARLVEQDGRASDLVSARQHLGTLNIELDRLLSALRREVLS
jgi:HPt (histidine-containing phosphotransfer) domain-containing protein